MVNVVTQAEKGYLYLDVNKIQLISLQSPKQLHVGGRCTCCGRKGDISQSM